MYVQAGRSGQSEREALLAHVEELQADRNALQEQVEALGHAQRETAQEMEELALERAALQSQIEGLEAARAALQEQLGQHGDVAERLAQQACTCTPPAMLWDKGCVSCHCMGDLRMLLLNAALSVGKEPKLSTVSPSSWPGFWAAEMLKINVRCVMLQTEAAAQLEQQLESVRAELSGMTDMLAHERQVGPPDLWPHASPGCRARCRCEPRGMVLA